MDLPVLRKELHSPSLEEVASVLKNALQHSFSSADVSVVECPNLKESPFGLTGTGLCGSARIGEIGGMANLFPLVNKSKVYDVQAMSSLIDLPDAFIIGPGAGPLGFIGTNTELMLDVTTGKSSSNGSYICKIDPNDNSYILEKIPLEVMSCSLMLNFFASEGKGGKVLRVHAKERKSDDNFVSIMRKALLDHYKDRPVGLGGTFLLKQGTVKCHVMPSFSEVPLNNDEDINKWLKFFDMDAPMVFFSVFLSKDPGVDFRLEHTHGYGPDRGGHYHYDVTPDKVEYLGYFNVADSVYRVDKPSF